MKKSSALRAARTTLLIVMVVFAPGCAVFRPPFTTDGIVTLDRKTLENDFIEKAKTAKDGATAANLVVYFDAGVNLSNVIANDWFNVQFHADRGINHNKGVFNIVGSTTVGALGLTGTAAKQIGLFGLGLAGGNAEFENYMSYYLVSPALEKVKKKFDEGRSVWAARLREAIVQEASFEQTRQALFSYHNLSSRIEIARILSESVDLIAYAPPDAGNGADKQAVAASLISLHTALIGNAGVFDEETARALYVLEFTPAGTSTSGYQAYASNAAYAALKAKADALKTDPAKYQAYIMKLRETGKLVGGPGALSKALSVPGAPAAPAGPKPPEATPDLQRVLSNSPRVKPI